MTTALIIAVALWCSFWAWAIATDDQHYRRGRP